MSLDVTPKIHVLIGEIFQRSLDLDCVMLLSSMCEYSISPLIGLG